MVEARIAERDPVSTADHKALGVSSRDDAVVVEPNSIEVEVVRSRRAAPVRNSNLTVSGRSSGVVVHGGADRPTDHLEVGSWGLDEQAGRAPSCVEPERRTIATRDVCLVKGDVVGLPA